MPYYRQYRLFEILPQFLLVSSITSSSKFDYNRQLKQLIKLVLTTFAESYLEMQAHGQLTPISQHRSMLFKLFLVYTSQTKKTFYTCIAKSCLRFAARALAFCNVENNHMSSGDKLNFVKDH